jgi:hypothetical protein
LKYQPVVRDEPESEMILGCSEKSTDGEEIVSNRIEGDASK